MVQAQHKKNSVDSEMQKVTHRQRWYFSFSKKWTKGSDEANAPPNYSLREWGPTLFYPMRIVSTLNSKFKVKYTLNHSPDTHLWICIKDSWGGPGSLPALSSATFETRGGTAFECQQKKPVGPPLQWRRFEAALEAAPGSPPAVLHVHPQHSAYAMGNGLD